MRLCSVWSHALVRPLCAKRTALQHRALMLKRVANGMAQLSTHLGYMGHARLPEVKNEPTLDYKPGSPERKILQDACARLRTEAVEVPCLVNGKEVKTGVMGKQVMPSDHKQVVAKYHKATPDVVDKAIKAALDAKSKWERIPFEERATIFMKAASLLSTKYRADVCAAVMLGTGKTVWQAEIDAAAESVDFLRMNCKFAQDLYAVQPVASAPHTWNRMDCRPLEGFIYAVSPFNFCAIGTNLATQPAVLGNVILWKPSSTSLLGNWITMKVLQEAGLPDGVINFLPGSGSEVSASILNHPMMAGVHFTGSNATFNNIWRTLSNNLGKMKTYPRMVGETGGKNFHFVHASAAPDLHSVVAHTVRSAFEYQGQKCSACSRLYCPESLWAEFKTRMITEIHKLKVGQPDDFSTFMSAVIDRPAFDRITSHVEKAKASGCEVVVGGNGTAEKGYFIHPTVLLTKDPKLPIMETELFGPVVTVYVYPDDQYEETLKLCDETSPYGLTGAIFARDREAIQKATDTLRHAAGNFYVNAKSTGAVVGQQAFGGARQSGTNDKAGSAICLTRWISWRVIKEEFTPLGCWSYPHMA